MNEEETLYDKLIELIRNVFHKEEGLTVQISPDDMEKLYILAEKHMLSALVCTGLEETGLLQKASPEIMKKWKEAQNKAIRKNMLLDAEREQVFKEMDAAGIWHLPLKGSVLKSLYPKPWMRQMSDNDILFDPEYQSEVKDIMVKRGYLAKSYGEENHDVYIKEPIYNFEMHTSLFGEDHKKVWQDYYTDVKSRLIPVGNGTQEYRFSDDDFYIYLTVHAFHHYEDRGTGLRTLVDSYVYIWKKSMHLDWDYIRYECEKLGIDQFERGSRMLALKLWEPHREQNLTEEERQMFSYMTGAGIYGTQENRKVNQLKKMGNGSVTGKTKMQYFFRRLFPDREWFVRYKPVCARHPWIIPFYRIFRVFYGVTFGFRKMRKEVQVIQKVDR